MCLADRFRCLQFKNNPSIHNKISSNYSDRLSAKAPRNQHLRLHFQLSLSKRNPHSLTVYRFQKPESQLVINLIKRSNKLLGQRIIAIRKLGINRITLYSYQFLSL